MRRTLILILAWSAAVAPSGEALAAAVASVAPSGTPLSIPLGATIQTGAETASAGFAPMLSVASSLPDQEPPLPAVVAARNALSATALPPTQGIESAVLSRTPILTAPEAAPAFRSMAETTATDPPADWTFSTPEQGGRNQARPPSDEEESPPREAARTVDRTIETARRFVADSNLEPLFDGSPASQGAEPAPPKAGAPVWRVLGKLPLLGRLVPSRWSGRRPSGPKPPRKKTPLDWDANGGPPRKELSALGRILYGVRWSLNLLAIGAFLEYAVQPLINRLPWSLWLPEAWLNRTGRVELLAPLGPEGIASAIAQSPWSFLFWELPRMTAWEEIVFRLIGFSLILFPLMGLRAALPWLIEKLGKVPNVFRIRGSVQLALKGLRWLTGKAFWIAALVSTLNFAAAHFAAWGIHPYTFLAHSTLGLLLTYIAYRSRSILSSTVAHYLYNLLGILLAVAAPLVLGGDTAAIVKVLASVFFAAALYFNFRAYLQDRAALRRDLVPASGPVSTGRKLPHALLEAVVLFMAVSAPGLAPWAFRPPADPKLDAPPSVVLPPRLVVVGAPPDQLPEQVIIQQTAPSTLLIITGNRSGTGFIVEGSGLAVTNAHVAGPAGLHGYVTVRLSDGRVTAAEVVGLNSRKDLAILKLPPAVLPDGRPTEWPALRLADSDRVQDGDFALAMGFPMGSPLSASRGIISGTKFRASDYVDFFQTDAAMNPGNSGGPLLNGQGEVIGVNTQIKSMSGGSQGLGFSIRSNIVRSALEQYKKDGTISPVYLGVIVDLRDTQSGRLGLRVEQVRPDTPAAAAGLRAGDVILSINGTPLGGGPRAAVSQARRLVANLSPGAKIALRIRREESEQTVELGVSLALGDEDERPDPAITRFYGALPPMVSRFLPSLNPPAGPPNPR